MVGQQPLELPIGVRVPASQPYFNFLQNASRLLYIRS